MAILNGIIKKMNGSAGSLTFKTVAGRTIVSEKMTTVRNTHTDAQQRQRMKWANIIRMYSGITPLLMNGFEKKEAGQSDYNVFVRLNTACVPVYLSKAEADGGACIAAPYQITRGILPSIEVTGTGAETKTDISIGSLTIDADTTVAQFSQAVVNNNPDYSYGEQISFFSILQEINELTGIPYCQFGATAVVLNKSSEVKLWDFVNKAGFASVSGFLGHGEDEGDGCYAWVHSSYSNGKTHVSTQFLIDNNSLLPEYTSADAFTMAAESYGGINDVFLTPDPSTGSMTDGGGNDTPGGGSGSGGDNEGGDSGNQSRQFTITVLSADSNMGTVTGGGTFSEGSVIQISASPKIGNQFEKWSDGVTTPNRNITVTQNLTLTASFVADENPGGGGSGDNPGDYD